MVSSYLHWHLGADVDLAHSLVQRAASSIVDRKPSFHANRAPRG
jgi:hypothetical protein